MRRLRIQSIAGFSFLAAYMLSFLFEGQVLYGLLTVCGDNCPRFVLSAILAHFVGLACAGFFVKSARRAKAVMLVGMSATFVATLPFFFGFSHLWITGLIVAGFSLGCAVASWGYFMRAYTPTELRLKTSADVLIWPNVIMMAINVITLSLDVKVGLALSLASLFVGIVIIAMLPTSPLAEGADGARAAETANSPAPLRNTQPRETGEKTSGGGITRPLALLSLFVFIVTIDSGLMYQVVTPSFSNLHGLVSWYWTLPYVGAIVVIRNLPATARRSLLLYVGMGMMVVGFVGFMMLGDGPVDFLLVNTFLLGALGVMDLFWWSTLAQMLDYTDNPARVFGIGLSANVLGVLVGDILGISAVHYGFSGAEVTVIALTVLCITLALLPPLNQRLVHLLSDRTYLTDYEDAPTEPEDSTPEPVEPSEPLTAREQEVLAVILMGKPNRQIAKELFISENTVKTHARNIYLKYGVSGRTELLSMHLNHQAPN